MEITHIAHSCFTIKGKDLKIVIDPYDPKIGHKEPKLEADVLVLSHDHFDHAHTQSISGHYLTIDGPGEYETKGTFINGFQTYHDDKQGAERGKNTIYSIEIDGFTVVHLGDLGHELSKDALEKMTDVDVLLIPVGGNFTIDAKKASKVISSIEPKIVVPMHYQTDKLSLDEKLDSLDKFLEEMGAESPKNLAKLSLSKRSEIPDETEVIVLTPTH
jgi:L-ascorbate metabolism protein UlaG (beta-lactamase superfamily)